MVMSLIESLTKIKNAVYGREVREAIHDGVFRANQIADGADIKADKTQIRQDAVEDFNTQVIQEMTDKDVISAPEIIEARNGEETLGDRLDSDFSKVHSSYKNIAEMVSDLKLSAGRRVSTEGYYVRGDGGGANYEIRDSGTSHSVHLDSGLHAVIIPDTKEVDIRQLGASPNVDDNGPMIRAAIELSNGIYIPDGFFKTSSFTLSAHKHMRGAGVTVSRLIQLPGVNEDFITLLNPTGQIFENLQIVGNKATNPLKDKALVKITTDGGSSYNHVVRNLHIRDGAGFGLHMTNATGSYNWVHTYNNIMIDNCTKGMYDNTTDNKYHDFYISGCEEYGLYCSGGSNLYNNFKIDWCGGQTSLTNRDYSVKTATALGVDTITGGLVVNYGGNLHFTNLDVQSTANVGIKLMNTFGVKIKGSVNNCGTAYTYYKDPQYLGVGVYIYNSSGCDIDVVAYSVYEDSPQSIDIQTDALSQGNRIYANEIKGQFLNIINAGLNNRIIDGSKYHLDRGADSRNYTNYTQPSSPGTTASDSNTQLVVDSVERTISATGSSAKGAFIAIPVVSIPTDNEAFFFKIDIRAPFAFEIQLVKGDTPYEFIKIGRSPNRGGVNFHTLSKVIQSGKASNGYTIRIIPLESVSNYSGTTIRSINLISLRTHYGHSDVPSVQDMLKMYAENNITTIKETSTMEVALYR